MREQGRAVTEHGGATREHTGETGVSARAEQRRLSQQLAPVRGYYIYKKSKKWFKIQRDREVMKVQQIVVPDYKKSKGGAKEYESPLIDENSRRQGGACMLLFERREASVGLGGMGWVGWDGMNRIRVIGE